MTIAEALPTVRYVTDAKGEKTDVLVSLTTWTALLAAWQQLIEKLEDQEDRAIIQEWLGRRARGEAKMISLDQYNDLQELINN